MVLHRAAVDPVRRGLGPGVRAVVDARGVRSWCCSRSSTPITDPPIRALRRVIPPLRLGSVALDLSFLIVMIGAYVLLRVNREIFLVTAERPADGCTDPAPAQALLFDRQYF